MAESPDDVSTSLARSARLQLFVALRHTRDPQRMKDMLGDHLRWMAAHERDGGIFLSGPVIAGGDDCPDGLTVLRAKDMAAAERLIRQDPLVASGIVEVSLCEWTVNEGMVPLRLTLSNSGFTFA